MCWITDLFRKAFRTSDITVEKSSRELAFKEEPKLDLPDFHKMTKTEIADWSLEFIGVELNVKHKKDKMIQSINEHLYGDAKGLVEFPDFSKMKKADIVSWADTNMGLKLDAKRKKADLIKEITGK